jgi:protein TonB
VNKFVLASLVGHVTLFYALSAAALRPEKPKLKRVELAIVQPKAPEPPPPPPPPPPAPKKVIDLTQKVEVKKDPKPAAEPPPPPSAEPPPPPVFGVSLSSTSQNNSGFNVRVGNTTMTEPGEKKDPKDVKPLQGAGGEGKGPVSIAQVSKLPQKIGDCPPFDPTELYTKEAKDKEIEGQVTLEVVVTAEGSVGDVKVVKGVGYGLDEAAVSTMRKHCKFQPAEMGADKVSTKIRYTFTFVLPE